MALLTSRYLDIISSGHSLKFFRKIVKIERVTLRVVILDESQIYTLCERETPKPVFSIHVKPRWRPYQ